MKLSKCNLPADYFTKIFTKNNYIPPNFLMRWNRRLMSTLAPPLSKLLKSISKFYSRQTVHHYYSPKKNRWTISYLFNVLMCLLTVSPSFTTFHTFGSVRKRPRSWWNNLHHLRQKKIIRIIWVFFDEVISDVIATLLFYGKWLK